MERVKKFVALGHFDKALRVVERERANKPRSPALLSLHASVLRRLGRPAEGAALLEPEVTARPKLPGLNNEFANCLRQVGDLARSLAVTDATLSAFPKNRTAQLNRILALKGMRRFDEALRAIEAARGDNPRSPDLLLHHALTLRSLGRPAEGATLLETELMARPNQAGLRNGLARCLRDAGELERSLALTEATLAESPGHPAARSDRIMTLHAMSRFEEALPVVEEARTDDPGSPVFLSLHAATLRSLGRPAEGAALLEQDAAVTLSDLRVRDELARCLRESGELKRSLAIAEETLEASPGHRVAQRERVTAVLALHDRKMLEALLASLLAEMDDADADMQLKLSSLHSLVRILPSLPSNNAVKILSDRAAQIQSRHAQLDSETKWNLFAVSGGLGLASRFRFLLDDLFRQTDLPASVAIGIIEESFVNGSKEWFGVATEVARRTRETERWQVDLHVVDLRQGCDAALAARKGRMRPKSPAASLFISDLLDRSGRIRLALRYVRFARLTWPRHNGLYRMQLRLLVRTDGIADLRALIESSEQQTDQFRAMAIQALIEIGDAAEAERRIGDLKSRHLIDRDQFSLFEGRLRQGEVLADDSMFDTFRAALPHRSAIQFGPSINGVLKFDLDLISRSDAPADHRLFVPPAGRAVDAWMKSRSDSDTGGCSVIPRKVLQYWDKNEPPRDIAQIMASWEAADGVSYYRFSRPSASVWLRSRLGEDWQTAIQAARSPAEQADFFRLAWLMLEGGIYADSDDRLIGDLSDLLDGSRGLTVFREPLGLLANNVILAPPMHPAIVWAAHAAKRALLERHNDNTWTKTGPGLMTRAVAWYLDQPQQDCHDLRIVPLHALGRWVQVHVKLPYKRTINYWNRKAVDAGGIKEIEAAARGHLSEAVPEPGNGQPG